MPSPVQAGVNGGIVKDGPELSYRRAWYDERMRNNLQPCQPQNYDFHCHSTASDGMLAPRALVERAAQRGVRRLALTDHDTLRGLPEAAEAAAALGVELIPGIELSVSWDNRELHLVGLNIDPQQAAMLELVEAQQQARRLRAEKIGARLDKAAGLIGSYQRAAELADTDAPGRPWFARMLVAEGKVRDMNHAFDRYLRQGQSAFVKTPWVTLTQAIAVINEAGGLAVLAHPLRYGLTRRKLRKLLGEMTEHGRCALEVALPGQNMSDQRLLDECLRDFELLASGGSDFHSPEQKWLDLGRLPELPAGARPVWEGFQPAPRG